MPLTDKQKRFVEEYLVDLSATQAAIRAGYSAKTAEQQAYKLLQKTSVSCHWLPDQGFACPNAIGFSQPISSSCRC